MFIHNIDPVLFSIGPLEVRYYGLAYVIGFLFVLYFLNKKKDEIGLNKNNVENLLIYIIIGTVVGARLFEALVWNPSYYLMNPLKIFAIWEGGMSLHGGIIGVIAACLYFCKKYKVNAAKLADIIVIPALIGLVLGRIANFINGELVGTVSSLPWCVKFPGYDGCRHPVQLYGAAGRALLFGYLLLLPKVKKWKDGFIFWNFVLLMGIGRFIIDFLREDIRYLGLSIGQYLSLVMVVIAVYVLWKYYKK